jgi:hypothetical protein
LHQLGVGLDDVVVVVGGFLDVGAGEEDRHGGAVVGIEIIHFLTFGDLDFAGVEGEDAVVVNRNVIGWFAGDAGRWGGRDGDVAVGVLALGAKFMGAST